MRKSAALIATAVTILTLSACKETAGDSLGTVVEVDKKNTCRIRVAPESDRHGYGHWVDLRKNECGKYKTRDKYPKVFP